MFGGAAIDAISVPPPTFTATLPGGASGLAPSQKNAMPAPTAE